MTPLQLFNLPSEDELDEYLQQDVSANTSQSFGSSPQLTTSDNCLLDPAFWINHPTQLHTIRQLIRDSKNAEDDWLDKLLGEPFICHSDCVRIPTPQLDCVHTQTSSSITKPESDIIPVTSIDIHVPTPQLNCVHTQTSSSITEPESDGILSNTINQSQAVLNCNSFFATPSPPPPGSLYWKYFTQEEEAKFYDCSHTNEVFQEIHQKKYELEVSMHK
ncbi:hypothetical protein EDD22DRAFT_951011 [Suillus occidentalis]|nr:hypothetical protein EDD22DRAFT_951011 [Suillus occidentalis]